MNTVDIVILVLLGYGAVRGYMRGFIVESFSFLAFFIGLFLALKLTVPVAEWLFQNSSFFEIASILVFIALFVLLSLAIKAGAKAIKGIIDTTIFGAVDNFTGAIAGSLKWAFIISIISWVLTLWVLTSKNTTPPMQSFFRILYKWGLRSFIG